MRTRVPPPCYALLAGAVIWAICHYAPEIPRLGAPWRVPGWTLVTLGVALDLTALLAFLRRGTTVDPIRPARARRLVTSGVYRYSRNPMYLGLALVLAGWTVLVSSPLCLPIVIGFMKLIDFVQIQPEEAALSVRFGAAYASYRAEVHRWWGRQGRSAGARIGATRD
jgi:protein-S-isoprenylcysteine O-methyltransferase Ste14